MALIARRLGGAPLLALTLVGCAVLVRALGLDRVADPWNPYLPVLPFGCLLLLCWAAVCGERWALPVAAAVASFCAQTHIGYVPLALPLLAVAAVGYAVKSTRGEALRTGLITAGVLAVLWAAPVVEELRAGTGNLTEVVRYFRSPSDDGHTLTQGLRVVTGAFGLPPEWIAGARPPNPFSGEHEFLLRAPWPVLLLPFAAAVAFLWRRRDAVALRLAALVVLALALGVVSVARTTGSLFAYRLHWTALLAMLAGVVTGWAAWTAIAARVSLPSSRALAAAALAPLVVLGAVNTVLAVDVETPYARPSTVLDDVLPTVVDSLPSERDAVAVHDLSLNGYPYMAGLVLGLERRGIPVGSDQLDERALGSRRVVRDGEARTVLTVAVDAEIDVVALRPGARRVAYWGMPDGDRARRVRRIAALDAEHDTGRLSDAAWVGARLAALPPESAVAVFAEPGGAAAGSG
jgi:hypothetical protein